MFKTIGVIGAGPMGVGIAQTALTSGLAVVLFDLDADVLQQAKANILARISRMIEKRKLDKGFDVTAEQHLILANSLEDLSSCDFVIEAIIERLEPKQELFAHLENVVGEKTVLATNTSSISVAAIASVCTHRERVCGMHFFNPVPLMQLVEVIKAPSTSDETILAGLALSQQLRKTPVIVKDGPGFLVNLAGRAYVTEALHIVQEGVTDVATVDRIMRHAAGFPMGPFQLMDLTGIDVNFPATNTIYQGFQHDPRLKTTTLHELMCNAGFYGQKTGRGYHDYSDGGPDLSPVQTAADGKLTLSVSLPEPAEGLDTLQRNCGFTVDSAGVSLVAPTGEDATAICHRLNLDPAHTVAIDLTAIDRQHLTLMSAPGGSAAVTSVAACLRSHGYRVEVIKDSPGFVLQRILAMIANLGCELAQIGVGAPDDIDTAMKLAQNYPKGPLEWADYLGPQTVYQVLQQLQMITGSDRYRPSLWLRRRALLNLSSKVES